MQSFGNLDLQDNDLQQVGIGIEANFPVTPKAGRLVFKDKILYICAEINEGVPAWVPLTNELDTYVYHQNSAELDWVITHNLNSGTPNVQVYGTDSKMIIPDDIEVLNANQVKVSLTQAAAGRAVIIVGSNTGLAREQEPYELTQTTLADSWTLYHGLGYVPVVRVFIGESEVLPQTITHPDLFTTVVTFATPQVGVARAI